MEQIEIKTKSKQYPLYIGEGLRFQVKKLINDTHKNVSSILIITDSNVAPLFLHDIKAGLANDYHVHHYIVPGSEAAKSFQNYYDIQTFALEKGLDRSSLVLALGGGVVGDLAGFIAATYMRGISFIQLPTTILAHDSSVGGKVAINHPLGKNMIGAFHQPDAVIYDIDMLRTLPDGECRSGFAEIIKHALIWDKEFLDWIQRNVHSIHDLEGETLQYALIKGILVKASVVAEDENEKGIRAFLNFGHTLAHALESELGYGKISHGDAVAIGMLFAIRVSEKVYGTDLNYAFFKKWFDQYGFPSIPRHLNPERLLQLMKKDKKVHGGLLRMVLMKEVGRVEVVTLDDELILDLLKLEIGRE